MNARNTNRNTTPAVRTATMRRLQIALPAAVAALLALLAPAAHGAGPMASAPGGKLAAVTLEPIPGSAVKRVVLSAKAAERLGIETGLVGEQAVVFKQIVSGLVTTPPDRPTGPKPGGGTFGGFAQRTDAAAPGTSAVVQATSFETAAATATAAPTASQQSGSSFAGFGKAVAAPAPQPAAPAVSSEAAVPHLAGDAWVLVSLSQAEWERLARDKPARLLTLATREKLSREVFAQPSGMAPTEDVKRSMLSLYYVVPAGDHGLVRNTRMRVELQISGDEDKHKVVPYSAVYYDGKGAAWVYVNTRPLAFERQRITVERVVGDVAVLSDGPPAGTPVVTVGAALLFGAELFGK